MASIVPTLPEPVRSLMERKLGLLKREFEQEHVGNMQRTFSKLRDGMREHMRTGAIGKVLISVPIEVYRERATEALAMTKRWPMAVWDAMAHVLDKAGLRGVDEGELSSLVDKFAWAPEQTPFTLEYIQPDRFRDAVYREANSCGIGREDMKSSFERQLNLLAASSSAAIMNHGRQAREAVAVAIGEFFLALPTSGMELSESDEQELPEKRRERLKVRVNQERAKGTKAFLKVVAAEEGISIPRLKQLVYEKPEPANKWTAILPKTSSKKAKPKS